MSKCKRPCKGCAFRNDSIKGYFGGNTIDVYQGMYQSDVPVPCHMKSPIDDEGNLIEAGTPCVGHLLAQAKSCKSPRSTESANLIAELKEQDNYDELKSQVLASWEFNAHHSEQEELVN